MSRPLLWDIAKYFTLQKILATLSNTDVGDGGQSSNSGQGQGNGTRNLDDRKSIEALFFYAFRS
jgi:hypothetical protein